MMDFEALLAKTKAVFATGRTLDVEWRRRQLQGMLRLFTENEDLWCEALMKDLGKPRSESIALEVQYNANHVRTALARLDEWVQDEHTEKSVLTIMDKNFIHRDPYGVVLVMGAWNYPVMLSLGPVIAAVAAGNGVFVKPSEISEHTATLMEKLVPRYMDPELIKVVTGGIPETTEILKLRFDYIFFTGSPFVGKIIATAASKHLIPCTLELGGKSPLFIDDTVDMVAGVKRLLWGKMINLGQTCVAPDYILCNRQVQEKFLTAVRQVYKEWYGPNSRNSKDIARIVNQRNYDRLNALLEKSKGKIAFQGSKDPSTRFLDLTVVTDVKEDDSLMSEEIFGPILPIMNINGVQEAIDFINAREKPLSLYIFTNNAAVKDKIITNTSSGSICCNDTIVQLSVESLPFGGVGNSGYGSYHGHFGYDTFSHKKAILDRGYNLVGEKLGATRFPPYTSTKMKVMDQLMYSRRLPSAQTFANMALITAGIGFVVFYKAVAKRMGYETPEWL